MKKGIVFFLFSTCLLTACEWFNSSRNRMEPAEMMQAMQGGWEINPSTTEERWYFSSDGTFVRLTRYDEQFGTWRIEANSAILTTNNAPDGQVVDVVLDNNVLLLGNLSLARDTTVEAKLEQRLADKLVGVWKSDIEEVTYEFMPSGYMLIKYSDDMSEDGRWRIEGNRLIENESEYGAAPIAFDGNKLEWGTETFSRIGDARADLPEGAASESPSDGVTQPKGQAIRAHSFQANLGNFGEVIFEPYWEDRFGDSRVHFYLSRNGVAVYELPAFNLSEGKFDGLRSTASRDVNSDGKLDIIIMADYLVDGPENATVVEAVNGVYLNQGASFRLDKTLSDKINEQSGIENVNDLVSFARKNAGRTASTSGTRSRTRSSGPNLAQYRSDRSICRIRVAAIQGEIDYDKIAELSDLGILSFEPADNGYTRVYLGKYIGKYTAYSVLQRVKRRGHPSAFVVVEQDFINDLGEGDPPYSTYQVSSAKKLNAQPFNQLDDQYRGDVYFTYSGGRYRVSFGLFQRSLYPYLEQEFATLGTRMGYTDGFFNVIN